MHEINSGGRTPPSIQPAGSPRRPRRGLVLGAGGVLGAAWTTGALCALEEVEGFDPRSAEVVVGRSAGAVLAALLGAGVSAPHLRDHQRRLRVEGWELDYDHDSGVGAALPTRPRLSIGSRALLWRAARHPSRVTPMATMSAVLPLGTGSLEPVRRLIGSISPDGPWSPHPGVRIVAMDYDTGKRVAFGKPAAPAALADAVAASCAIPGWYAPSSSATGGMSTAAPVRRPRSICSPGSGLTRSMCLRRWPLLSLTVRARSWSGSSGSSALGSPGAWSGRPSASGRVGAT